MNMPEATVEITVPYHDCDPGGVVWHGNYLRYFDAARCALLDTISYGYLEMAAAGAATGAAEDAASEAATSAEPAAAEPAAE